MTEAEIQVSLIYTSAFDNPREWTAQDHLNGLKAVFAAGAKAATKRPISTQEGTK